MYVYLVTLSTSESIICSGSFWFLMDRMNLKLTDSPGLLSDKLSPGEKASPSLSEQAWNMLSNHSEAFAATAVVGALGTAAAVAFGLRRGRVGEISAVTAGIGEKSLAGSAEARAASSFRFKPELPKLSAEELGLAPKSLSQLGPLEQEHLRAIQSVKTLTGGEANEAAAILDNFGRAHAQLHGVDVRKANTVEVLRELQRTTGENLTPTRLSEAILSYDRLGGPFTLKQLQDPHLADLLIEHGNVNAFSARAVNTLSRLIGTPKLYDETRKIGIVSEYLGNGGNWLRFDTNDLQAAVTLASIRKEAAQKALGAEIKISPSTISQFRLAHDFK